MTPNEREQQRDQDSERLRSLSQELSDRAKTMKSGWPTSNRPAGHLVSVEGLSLIIEAIIPAIREVIRQELKALRPLDEAWYGPVEIEALSCGRVRAKTIRHWLAWGQIDGESDGRQVQIPQSVVEELRKNKWRPLRQPDISKLPQSRRPKN
ncbi:MAG: hypothetical protein ABFC88_02965 [Thermoguttaceae bacterium]